MRTRILLLLGLALTACSSTVNSGPLDANGDTGPQDTSSPGGDIQITMPSGSDSATEDTDTSMGGDTIPPSIRRPAAIAGPDFAAWTLAFHDEFDTADTVTAGSQLTTGKLWYNGTEQCCMGPSDGKAGVMYPTPVNGNAINPYSVVDGILDITLQLVDSTWTSGVMTTVDNSGQGFAQQYGYFEMRAKFPAGPGTWPAFWLLDQRSKQTGETGGEIDIIEQYGQFPHGMCTTLHDWRNTNAGLLHQCGDTPTDPATGAPVDWTTGYHTVAMLWTADTMTFYVDDMVYATSATPDIMKMPYYVLVNLGIGGGWPTDQTPDPSVMQVDYVRVWGQ